MKSRTLIIINPAAGRHSRWRRLESSLTELGLAFDRAISSSAQHARALARNAAGSYDLLVAAGGDGTVCEVMNGLMSGDGPPQATLAILPLGTGNDSARAVGIHNDEDALRALGSGTVRCIDLIEIDCRTSGRAAVQYAMLFASTGISTNLLKHTTPRLKSLFGQRLAYGMGLLFALPGYVAPVMKISCDGVLMRKSLVLASASNGETFGGGMRIAPGAALDDGVLNINLIESIGTFEALRHLRLLYAGRHIAHPKVCYKTAHELAIETDPPIEVAADGDLIGETPAMFRVRPRTLKLLVPTGTP